MSPRPRLAVSFGGLAFVVGGALLSGSLLLISLLPDPPANHVRLVAWVENHSLQISVSNELMFFGIVLLAPAVLLAGQLLRKSNATAALLGCASLLLALTLLGTLVPAEGRLAYPVFDIELGDETIALVVSLFYAGLHTVQLLLGIGCIALGFGVRRTAGIWLLLVSVGAGVFQLAGALPWLTPVWFNAAVPAAFFVWTLGTGFWLLRRPADLRGAVDTNP